MKWFFKNRDFYQFISKSFIIAQNFHY